MKVINIIGYEGLYAVSDDGRFFSLKTGNEISPSLNEQGYLFAKLSKDGHSSPVYVHKAVFYSFNHYRRLTRTDDLVIDHIDGDKTNNHLDNLRRVTTRENTSRAKVGRYSRGVRFFQHLNKYGAEIGINGERYYLGTFCTEQDASDAYQKALSNYNESGTLPSRIDHSTKLCKSCTKTLPIDAFYLIKGHGRSYLCKDCQKAYAKQRRAKLKSDV